ncbi:hypothetical protein [Pseudomonas sp. zfem002]|uniref:hypothetical protein n=1 Tax=Pseudomonas sp. zfem002 TaxID=3078197 RepID=UPI00292816D3|nr:hypothetical protein [Pseudomonas sp. zfem002]MDU9391564.1 hypothetical protein [Pseudomonas sp. zfem002]
MTNTSRITFTGKDVDRLVETVAGLLSFAEDEAAATCDNEENATKAWDAADNARELLEEIARKRNVSGLLANHSTTGTGEHGLDKAEGCKPDINFHILQLAERSCSLLEDWIQLSNTTDESLTKQVRETRAMLESQSPTWSTAVGDLLAERRRQIQEEGYTAERDDQYTEGQLAAAASTYAFWADPRGASPDDHLSFIANPPPLWPWSWSPENWKPTSQRSMLIKAGALILAELGRLDRQTMREVQDD